MNTKKTKKKIDINKLLNYSAIIILSLGSIIILLIIKDYIVPPDILNNYQITQSNIKLVLFFIIFTTYISLIHFPIKNLTNKKILIKTPPMGDKGPRGNRGKQGKKSICESCDGGDLCYKKILNNITLTYNWWRKEIKNLDKYPDSYVIKNEYLISKIQRHCKSDEFKQILNKFGSNNKTKNNGAYDYIFRMWSIWILIILKYDNGVLFLESSHLNETDFINLITDIDINNENPPIWEDMFITTDETGNDINYNGTNIKIKQLYDYTKGFIVESKGLNEAFFKTKGVPDINKTPFDEIKKYSAWFWGSDPNSKPKIEIMTKENDSNTDIKLYKTCVNYDKHKIKIMKTNNYYKIFSTDFSANKTNNSIITPFSQFGNNPITFLRPYDYTDYKEHFYYRNYRPIGDVVFLSKDVKEFIPEPNKCFPNNLQFKETFNKRIVNGETYSTILVSGNETSVKSPDTYECVYTSVNNLGINKNITAFNVFKPIPHSVPKNIKEEEKFVALGYVITTTPHNRKNTEDDRQFVPKPSTELIWCVHNKCLTDTKFNYTKKDIWNNLSKNLNGESEPPRGHPFTITKLNLNQPSQTSQAIQTTSVIQNKNISTNGVFSYRDGSNGNIDDKLHLPNLNLNLFKFKGDNDFRTIKYDAVCDEYDSTKHKYNINKGDSIKCICHEINNKNDDENDDEIKKKECNECDNCEFNESDFKCEPKTITKKYSILKLYEN